MNDDRKWDEVLRAMRLEQREDGLWSDPKGEIGVCRAACGLFVGWLDVSWEGPYTPFSWLRAVVHVPAASDGDLELEIERAHAARARAVTVCRFCRQEHVPGHMHDDVCHSCAERYLGVRH